MKSIANILSNIVVRAKKKELEEEILGFLQDNPNPPDSKVHEWAESNGYAVDDVEHEFYKLATKYAQLFKSGEALKKGISEKDVDPKELKMGIKVEMEHTGDPELAKKIALDHLAELEDYYTRLKKMESE